MCTIKIQPSVLDPRSNEQNLTNSTLYKYKQSVVPKLKSKQPLGSVAHPLLPMFVLLIEISSKFIMAGGQLRP